MSYTFIINKNSYVCLDCHIGFDTETKELAFFIDNSTEEDKNFFLLHKNEFKLSLIEEPLCYFVLEFDNRFFAFGIEKNDVLIDFFNKHELEIGFAFKDSQKELIQELCFTVDY